MTGEVELRAVTASDLAELFAHQLDPEAVRMAAFPARDRASFTAHWERIRADPAVTARTIVCGGEVAGNIVCFVQAGERLVGYWLGRAWWGRGIATRALRAFLDGVVAARPLHARVASHNAGSIRVLEKCGFVPVGRARVAGAPGGGDVEELVLRLG